MKKTAAKARQRYRYSVILLKELVRTDFKLRYQNSVLGYLWSLLKPLFMFGILYIIFVKFLKIGQGVDNWPIALLLGLVMWEFFNEVTKQGMKAIVGKSGIIRKINFPKYIIIIASSLSALINLLLNLVIVAVFLVFADVSLSWSFLLVPVFILELYIFALGCAFILSTLYVKMRDINFIWDVITRGGFYASAVLFPMSRIFDISNLAGQLLLLNPVAQTMNDARNGLLGESIPSTFSLLDFGLIFVPLGLVVASVVFGGWYFRSRSSHFAEEA